MRRLAGALVAVVAILGMKSYNKASTHDEVQARLVELCAGDNACQAAVRQHYDACFDASYESGGRHQASQLDTSALVECVNSHAGESYFGLSEEQQ